jgi:hypothetical protein
MIPDQQQGLFSMSRTSGDAPIIRRAPSSSLSVEDGDAAAAGFGWGDFPVVNAEYIAVPPSSSSSCDIDKQQEWSSTPPPHVISASSSSWRRRKYSSASSSTLNVTYRPTLQEHHDDSSPSLSLSLVSSSSDDEDDDDDSASNYSDESEENAMSITSQEPQQSVRTSSATRTSSTTNSVERHVHFTTVTVQEHEVVLGDHPWAGPFPLAIGWQHTAAREYASLDDYERERSSNDDSLQCSPAGRGRRRRRRTRSRGELPRRLSPVERCQRLFDVTGYSLASLQELEKKRQFEQENQTYPICDDDDDDEDKDDVCCCYQDKMRQLPADFYTTIVPPHQRRSYGTLRFF